MVIPLGSSGSENAELNIQIHSRFFHFWSFKLTRYLLYIIYMILYSVKNLCSSNSWGNFGTICEFDELVTLPYFSVCSVCPISVLVGNWKRFCYNYLNLTALLTYCVCNHHQSCSKCPWNLILVHYCWSVKYLSKLHIPKHWTIPLAQSNPECKRYSDFLLPAAEIFSFCRRVCSELSRFPQAQSIVRIQINLAWKIFQ